MSSQPARVAARAPQQRPAAPNPRNAKAAPRSLRELYDEGCADARVHANSALSALLPDRQGVQLGDTLDLSRNYLGDKGLVPLLLVVQRSPGLRELLLPENGLRNNAVRMLCAVAASHPSLQRIDLSDNYVSEGAAYALLQLLEDNPRIRAIGLHNTKISTELRVRISDKLKQNASDYGGSDS